MITIFICLFALLLAVLGFVLLLKPQIFLPLIGDSQEHRSFLRQFGSIYLVVAVAGIPVAIWSQRLVSFGYLFVALILTLVFSISFSSKMNPSDK
ncbi:hypothetical protein [Candidatus Enterococcus leclercqii]|uniref:hypothetical protein n=1 Tax=Candidatus Enterococcus leclercqii TaxID=1857218 RepID=UPI00137A96B2|nr:hypothetical protein [Enterococcus sp. CU9D]KAF1292824.1 hypothetical protein BAU14_10270 [Enterococcus sp. CU9D]